MSSAVERATSQNGWPVAGVGDERQPRRPPGQSRPGGVPDAGVVDAVLRLGPGQQRLGPAVEQHRGAQFGGEIVPDLHHARGGGAGQHRPGVRPYRLVDPPGRHQGAQRRDVGPHRLTQPVGPVAEQILAHRVAQPAHLGPHRHRVQGPFVQQYGEFVGGEAAGVGGEQQQDLGMSAGDDVPAARPGEQSVAAPEHVQPRARAGRRPLGQAGLHRVDGEPDQGQQRGGGGGLRTGDVEEAEQRTRLRVVHRGRRAGPPPYRLDEVLAGADPHRPVQLQRQRGGVGAGVPLVPP